tara:strand:- start:1285 stop:1596 length:312 start_codon:yes stop_codon:yes gene_type:complete
MSEVWSIFVGKINQFCQKLIKYSSIIIKNILSSLQLFSKSSLDTLEIKKLEIELNKERRNLGKYIFRCGKDKTYDFSNDSKYHNFIDKINEIENFITVKKNKN